jgi:hypothetical protein
MEDWEVEEKNNINVLEETKEKYIKPFEYAKPHVNVLDEVPQSYSHQINPELDQTRCTNRIRDHEYMNLEATRLLLRVCAFFEKKIHVIMDCVFVPFHIRASIVRHVELQNVATTLVDQP